MQKEISNSNRGTKTLARDVIIDVLDPVERTPIPETHSSGISADLVSVAEGIMRQSPEKSALDSRHYSYEVDADDRIVGCSDTWDHFAAANDGDRALSANIIGTLIWDHVSDEVTTALYKRIFKSARSGRPVQFFLRCDSPSVRRLLFISVSPTIEGKVRSTSLLFRADDRDTAYEIRQCGPADDSRSRTLCTWCNKIHSGDWLEVEAIMERDGAIPPVSYGICSECELRIEDQIATASKSVSIPAPA